MMPKPINWLKHRNSNSVWNTENEHTNKTKAIRQICANTLDSGEKTHSKKPKLEFMFHNNK